MRLLSTNGLVNQEKFKAKLKASRGTSVLNKLLIDPSRYRLFRNSLGLLHAVYLPFRALHSL